MGYIIWTKTLRHFIQYLILHPIEENVMGVNGMRVSKGF